MDLSNKVAVVTGAGRGIGRAIALKLAQAGADVVINDLDEATAADAAGEIKGLNRASLAVPGDMGSVDDVDRLFEKTIETFGRVDIAVNNAGITHPAVSILDLDLSWLDKVINIDFKGVYLCCRRAGREMVRQKSGCMINISSITGIVSLPLVVYGPMKSAVNQLTRILARDWAKHGVRVNAIAPGYVLTELAKTLIDKGERDPSLLMKRVPMHSFIDPVDIANAALFLASDEARFVTGEVMTVDAGWVADGGWSGYPIGHE